MHNTFIHIQIFAKMKKNSAFFVKKKNGKICNNTKNQNLHVVYNFHIKIMCGIEIPQMLRIIICLLCVFY